MHLRGSGAGGIYVDLVPGPVRATARQATSALCKARTVRVEVSACPQPLRVHLNPNSMENRVFFLAIQVLGHYLWSLGRAEGS